MFMAKEAEQKILECLEKEFPKDLSLEEIAAKTGIHRNTVSKYVWGLEKEKKVTISRCVGRARMYVISRK
jgi:DNA-binding IclR family transcriptional regulator